MTYEVVLLPGDGIGREVMAEAELVLRQLDTGGDVFHIVSIACGGEYCLEHGRDWPEGAEKICDGADVIFLGAVGWPDPSGKGPVTMPDGRMAGWSPVIGNRARLDLFANIRPVKLMPGVCHRIHGQHRTVWESSKVDLVFLRENTEGLYAGIGGFHEVAGTKNMGIDTRVITRQGADRVLRKAFEICRERGRGAPSDGRKRVTCIAKDNVLKGCQLFVSRFHDVSREFPDVEPEVVLVDAFAQWLMTQPEHYDVCVTTNMFGDILTDLASVLQGGMGLAVGCNVGDRHGMFEPIHGSAPRHAGKNRANPMAMILAVGEGLKWLGTRRSDGMMRTWGAVIEEAVVDVIGQQRVLTQDLVGEHRASSMRAVGGAIRERIAQRLAGS